MLGAQVKTVEDADAARIVLNRLDAEDLLRQTQATCLFGLHLQKGTVHFQFVNQGFMDSLLGLLDSKNKTFTIPFAEMSSDRMLFERQLRKLADPIEQSRLRIHLIKRRLKKAIPGVELYVGLTDDDTTYRVDVPWISAAFSIAPHARETARLQPFHEGTIDPDQGGVALHPAILQVFDEMKISKLTVRGATDRTERLTIQWKDKRATQNFEIRIFEDEVSYVHKSGLRLTMTAARKTPDGYVHEFQSDIFDSKRPAPLKGSALMFFRMFRENAVLTLPGGAKLPLSQFGKSLTNVGLAVDVLPSLSEGLSLPLANFFLNDIKNEEFARATWFLDALLFKEIPLEQMARGFIVGPAADIQLDQITTRAMSLSIPVVVNVKDMGIVVW
ncbi:MAG TPA: hypothetical protein VK638_47840, partial [Edaphobacter sp.]|nr:hypothetical protein [Edaphobacter sp.]